MAMSSLIPRLLFGTLVFVFATGCPKDGADDGDEPVQPAGEEVQAPIDETTGRPTPAALNPKIAAVGPDGAVPELIAIEFARPIVEGAPKFAGDETIFSIEPTLEGELEFRSATSLRFTPRESLKPETTYRVKLEAVETTLGQVRPASPWEHEFTTPAFELLSLSTAIWDRSNRALTVHASFSAPVDPAELGRFATWQADGRPLSGAIYEAGSDRHVVRVVFRGLRSKPEGIALNMSAGLPYDQNLRAPAVQMNTTLAEGPPVTILAARLNETPAGFVVEVICDDKASTLPSRYYWDQQTFRSHYISGRCLIEGDEARRSLRLGDRESLRTSGTQGGFRVVTDLERGSHTLRIDAGARTVDGGIVHAPFEWSFEVGPRQPALNFVAAGRYLPKANWKSVALRHRNVDAIELTIRHVPAANLSFWMGGADETVDERTSSIVVRERIPLRGAADRHTTSWIDVASHLPKPEAGVYEIRAKGQGFEDALRVMVTDINLVAKRHGVSADAPYSPRYDVWALDSATNAPVSGVRVDALRPSGQSLGSCTTDRKGGCQLVLPDDGLDKTPPIALMASLKGDITYLKFDEVQTRDSRARTDGKNFLSKAAYAATLYSDRGVYRPGETVHAVALIRNTRHLAPDAGLPVELRVHDSRQREILRRNLQTNPAGAVSLDVRLADFAVTGAYSLQVRVAGEVLETYRFHVEEFVPERLRVEASPLTANYLADEEIAFEVKARYLFGASAAGSPVELHCQLEAAPHRPGQRGHFHYGLSERDRDNQPAIDLGVTTGKLGADGALEMACPAIPATVTVEGPSRVVARAAVSESGSGRTSVAEASVSVHPGPHYVGLLSANEDFQVGRPIHVEGVVVDWEGLLLKTVNRVEVEFYRYDWSYNWFYDEETGRETRTQERQLTLDGTDSVAVVDGAFKLQVTPNDIGAGYLIRVRAENSQTELLLERAGEPWEWYAESQAQRTPRPLRAAPVLIEGPEEIEVGKASSIRFDAPYRGRVLLTAETHEVLAQEWRDVEAGKNEWNLTITGFVPNVYVSALIIKDPHLESKNTYLPERAFGVRSLRVKPSQYTQPLRLSTPTEVRSRSKLRAELELGPVEEGTYATVSVVDEGVLSLTRFQTPNPLLGIFTRRALGVDTFETVGWALSLPAAGTASRAGGGDDYMGDDVEAGDGLGRIMPVRPLALWSGLLEVPRDGKLNVDFDLPLYRGKLRVMAVTMSKNKIGSAQTEVVVRDPLTIQTTLPRFLLPYDEAQIPVFVTNMTDGPREVSVSLSAEVMNTGGAAAAQADGAPLRITGPSQRKERIGPGESKTLVFPIRALHQSGAARLVVRAKSGQDEVYDEAIVPLVPAGPRQREVKRIELSPGDNDLTMHLSGWVRTSDRSTLWVTAQPHAESFEHLSFLVRYPHGCLEQTTSTLRPMLFASQLLGQVDPTFAGGEGEIETMIRSGIDRILSMRHPGGGFTYWPGASYVDTWSSTYATHLLFDADRMGYTIPAEILNEALTFLENSLSSSSSNRGHYGDSEPYAHYVLAMAGRGRKAQLNQLINALPTSPRGRQAEEAYMLKAALYLAGDRRYEADLKRVDATPMGEDREMGYPFYSDLRYRGFVLNVFFDLFGNDPAGEALAERVATGLQGQRSGYFSTQELAWATTGLGKWYKGLASSFKSPTLLAGTRPIEAAAAGGTGSSDRSWSLTRASEYPELTLQAESTGERPLYALLTTEGVRTDGFVPIGGEGMELKREYLDGAGRALTQHSLGDLVYVRLTLTNTYGAEIKNVALVDRFPAGWELELANLGRDRVLPDWARSDEAWSVSHTNMRDDRVEVFGDLKRGERVVFIYSVRAVTAGAFGAPTVDAEAMYDSRIWAREVGEQVKIDGPWEEFID